MLVDICDGKLLLEHAIFKKNEQALQIIAYYDDFTPTGPLMSRAKQHKLGTLLITVMFSVLMCLPMSAPPLCRTSGALVGVFSLRWQVHLFDVHLFMYEFI